MRRIAVLTLALLAFAAPAGGHRQSVTDADDSPGPLDIAIVKNRDERMGVGMTHPMRSWYYRELRFRISTYEAWEASLLDGEFNFIVIEILRAGEDESFRGDLCFYIEPRGESYLQGRMFETCWPSPAEPKGRWRNVLRPDGQSAKAIFSRKLIGEGVESYRWRFGTSFEQEGHAECAPPEQMPPEKVYGACADFSDWRTHRM